MSDPFDDLRLTTEQFQEFLEKFTQHVSSFLADRQEKDYMPTLLIQTKQFPEMATQHTFVCFATDFNEGEQKRRLMMGMGCKIYEQHQIPVAIALASEAWMSQQSEDQWQRKMMPRDDPRRVEIIVVSAMTLDRSQKGMRHARIQRDAQNHIALPEAFSAIITDVECGILEHFFHGYLLAAEAGIQKGGKR
jgi:hypothetical protein